MRELSPAEDEGRVVDPAAGPPRTPSTRDTTASRRRAGWLIRTVTAASGPVIAVVTLLLVLVVVELLSEPNFGSWSNVTNLLRSTAIPLLLVIGMTLALLTGGVDLSVGATLAFSGILYAKLVNQGVVPLVALLVTLLVGTAIGFGVNGILIGHLRMSFFVVTLGTSSALAGLALLWSNNTQIDMSSDRLSSTLGNDAVLGERVPYSAIIAVVAVTVVALALRYTVPGRSVYAVGGNRDAAELSGVRSGWVVASVYGVNGLCAAMAAVMTIGRQTIADPTAGIGIELTVAAAALLAGVSLAGGLGSLLAAAVGTVFLNVLANALALRGFDNSWQMIVTGAILLVAVTFDRLRLRFSRAVE